jgi:hypothetical protein
MRKFGSVVVAVAIVVAIGFWWHASRSRSATSQSATSMVTTTMITTSTLTAPPAVCVAGGGSGAGTTTSASGGSCATWRPVDRWSGVVPSIYTTSVQPSASQPGVTAYAAWIRTSSTDLALYPGYEGPGATSLPRGPEMVPSIADPRLLAAFNSGFYESDGAAGFYVNKTLYFPMIDGLATVVRYADGTVDVVKWKGGPRPDPTVLMA